jgi:DNA-directed RNA polymerase subunit RPC12/RpoP
MKGAIEMTIYICKTCGKPYCKFEVPDRVNDRLDNPSICPWMSSPSAIGDPEVVKRADWSERK